MKTILLAGIAAVLLVASAAWPRRPALPGDQFQLAASDAAIAQMQVARDDDTLAQMQRAAGKSIMTSVAKGEGWM